VAELASEAYAQKVDEVLADNEFGKAIQGFIVKKELKNVLVQKFQEELTQATLKVRRLIKVLKAKREIKRRFLHTQIRKKLLQVVVRLQSYFRGTQARRQIIRQVLKERIRRHRERAALVI